MDYGALVRKLAAEYEMFLYALSGRYLQAITPGAEMSPKDVLAFSVDATRLERTFFDNAAGLVGDFVAPVFEGADDALKNSVGERVDAFLRELRTIAVGNIRTAAERLRGNGLTIYHMMKNAHGGVGLLLQKRLEKPEYKSKDRSGREWDSQRLVATSAREFAFGVDLRVRMEGYAAQGIDLLEVVYADPHHRNFGLVFSIRGESANYPSFEEIRKSVFHPNSTAQVKPYVPA